MASLVEQITDLLKSTMVDKWQRGGEGNYPYDKVTSKEKRRKPHALDSAFKYNVTYMVSPEMNYFEIGNPRAEQITPHYHILEDAKIIRFPKRGTNKSRGSQGLIKDKAKRDYSVLGYAQGKTTVVQEYRQQRFRNYFGKGTSKTTPREYEKRQKVTNENKRNYYYNKYFGYIEMLIYDSSVKVANDIGAKFVKNTDSVISVGEMIKG